MQFYILDADATTSARALPDYALKKVNLREGWQILSDCGHALGFEWEGQCREYNRYHPNTWKFWCSCEGMEMLWQHWCACLVEYERRFGRDRMAATYWAKYEFVVGPVMRGMIETASAQPPTAAARTAAYMLARKAKHLTEDEIKRLTQIVNRDKETQ